MKPTRNHIIVTGMHRSGTSYLVRALNLCGLNLGPESDFFDTESQPKFGNPRGHWENVNVTNLNENILKINGGSWHKVPNSLSKTPKNLDNKINKIIKSFYSEQALAYGFKDPRFCLTLDKWKKQLPNLVIVGVFRHPLKVAESLKKRDGFSYDESIELWKIYNKTLLSNLKKNKGFLINFDWPRKKLLKQTKIICSKIGLSDFDISNWYSDSYKKSDKSFTKSHKLNREIKEIYDKLKFISGKNNSIRYNPPKIKDKQYQMIVSDLLRHSNNLYSDTITVLQKNFEAKRKKDYQFIEKSPIGALLSIYYQRTDLQKKFPEVAIGDLFGLVEWAKKISSKRNRGEIITKKLLSKHSSWFTKYLINETRRFVQQEKSPLTDEIKQYKKSITAFQQEKSHLTDEVEQYKKSITAFQQEKSHLTDEVEQYKKSITAFQQEKSHLTDEVEQHKKSITAFQQEKSHLTDEVEQHKKSITAFQQEKSHLTDEIKQYKSDVDSRHQERTNLLNEIEKYKKNVDTFQQDKENLLNEIDEDKKIIDSLKFDFSQTKKEIDAIKSSISHKVVRFVGNKIEKISRKKKILHDIESTISASKKTIETEGVSSFLDRAKERMQRGEFLLQSGNFETTPIQLSVEKSKVITNEILSGEENIEQKFSASVVILTNSNKNSLQPLIVKINSQKGFKTLQIILVNSGKNDLSSLEKIPNIKCVSIEPQKFNHGKTRNLGTNEAKGDYIIFLTDDAIPASNRLFYDMCDVFSKDQKISVVTARQIPRSDSDLMSTFSLNEYYEHLDLTEDRIISTKNFDSLNSAEKRRTSQIDDVCSCYSSKILSKYPFRELQYAEDLDLGIRLVKDGYKIAQLFSTGVIHSHKRTPAYYAKRHFVETKVLSSLLNYHLFDFKKFGLNSVRDIFNHVFSLYHALNHTIDMLKQKNSINIEEVFELINNEITNFYSSRSKAKSMEPSIEKLFENFNGTYEVVKDDSFLLKDYLGSLLRFKNYLSKTYPNLEDIQDEFFDTLYKIFGVIIGNRLGGFFIFTKKHNSKIKNLEELEKVLESGV